jgi:LysM repeat protein
MNGKGWLVAGGLLIIAIFVATREHHPDVAPAIAAPAYAPPALTYTAPTPPPAPTTYVVQAGDGLAAIAVANGVTLPALMLANGFPSSEVPIHPGDVLNLPTAATGAPQPTGTAWAIATGSPTATAPTAGGGGPNPGSGWAATCPNGDCQGQISPVTGLPKDTYVHGYVKKDGTVVGGYYRSHR